MNAISQIERGLLMPALINMYNALGAEADSMDFL